MIDFSSIPAATKPVSPWRDVLIAVSVVMAMLAYMLFVMFVLKTDDPDVGVAPLSVVSTVGIIGFVVWAIVIAFRKAGKQNRLMAEFARVNNFKFKKPSRLSFADPLYNPPSSMLISSRTYLKYWVAGEVSDKDFEFYVLWGGTRPTLFQRSGLGFMTVLRTRSQLASESGDYITVESQGGYGYVSIRGNAFTRELIQQMFTSAGLY